MTGAGGSCTVRVKLELLDSEASDADALTVTDPTSPDAGVPLKVRVPGVKVSQEGLVGE